MRILFLNLASHDALIACSTEERVAARMDVHRRVSDHELLTVLEDVLAEAGWTYGDLTHLACITGPGGFTSLRITASCINTLARELDMPSAGIHLSDLYFARLPEHVSDVLWLHSTKRDQLFVRGGPWPKPILLSIDDFLSESPITNHQSPMPWTGELLDAHREAIDSEPVALRPVGEVLPGVLSAQEYNGELVLPWYGRGG